MLLAAALLTPPAHAAEAYGDAVYYVGDLHAHTGYSGDGASSDIAGCTAACGAFADVFADARAAGLDFLAVADHLNGHNELSDADWSTLHAAVLAANDPTGGFVTLPAGELWFYDGPSRATPIGHKTLLLFGEDADLAALTLDDVRPQEDPHLSACEDLWTWADTLAASGNLLLVPHHPATSAPMWTDWDCHSDTYEPAVEIYSRHGNSLEADSGYDVPGLGTVADGYVSAALDPDTWGLRIGFVGGTDAHDTRPGETCALDGEHPNHLYGGGLTIAVLKDGETFDRPALYDAIVDRRTLTTTGPVLTPLLTWSGENELGGLGEELTVYEDEDLVVTVDLPVDQAAYVTEVEATGPDGSWTLDTDGSGVWTATVDAADVPAWLYVRVTVDGDAWWGAGVCTDGGADATEYVWSSPSYVTRVDDDLDDDGVTARAGDCDDSDPAVFPGATDLEDGVDDDCDGADGPGDPDAGDPDTGDADTGDADTGGTGGAETGDADTGDADTGSTDPDDTGADPDDTCGHDDDVDDTAVADTSAPTDTAPTDTGAAATAAPADTADTAEARPADRRPRGRPPLLPDGSRPPRPPLLPDGSRPPLPPRPR